MVIIRMISLENYINKKGRKYKYIFEKADKFDFYSLSFKNFPHKACNFISSPSIRENMTLLQACWDFQKILPYTSTDNLFQQMKCGFYDNNLVYKKSNLIKKIELEMREEKMIFVILNIANYSLDEDEEYYDHHCTCFILHPSGDKSYNCFYINSHGEAMAGVNYFVNKLSNTRTKKYTYDDPIDIVCLKLFLSNIKTQKVINFNGTKEYTFYGCNLQSGDDYGICFIIPPIIWYNLIYFYDKEQLFTYKKNDSLIEKKIKLKTLLMQKRLSEFVEWCFAHFDKDYKNLLLQPIKSNYSLRCYDSYCVTECEMKEYIKTKKFTQLTFDETLFNKRMDDLIFNKGKCFIKHITVAFISFLTQQYIRNSIS